MKNDGSENRPDYKGQATFAEKQVNAQVLLNIYFRKM